MERKRLPFPYSYCMGERNPALFLPTAASSHGHCYGQGPVSSRFSKSPFPPKMQGFCVWYQQISSSVLSQSWAQTTTSAAQGWGVAAYSWHHRAGREEERVVQSTGRGVPGENPDGFLMDSLGVRLCGKGRQLRWGPTQAPRLLCRWVEHCRDTQPTLFIGEWVAQSRAWAHQHSWVTGARWGWSRPGRAQRAGICPCCRAFQSSRPGRLGIKPYLSVSVPLCASLFLSLCLSVSLSHTHTHTHRNTLPPGFYNS